ncbi:MAG: 2-deoxyglucose-6-phosphatase, partial [Pseudarthrobacter sp.]|nr:2-deoxyglucose-6-phosphatase [Pseudarthrobacter sp.]
QGGSPRYGDDTGSPHPFHRAEFRGERHDVGFRRCEPAYGVSGLDAVVFEDAPEGIAAGVAAGIRTVAVGPNTGGLPAGVLYIPDYSAVTATVETDAGGRQVISFRL